MLLYSILFLFILMITSVTQLCIGAVRGRIETHKKMRFLYVLDPKKNQAGESSTVTAFLNEVELRFDIGPLKKMKDFLQQQFILPKDFSLTTLILITLGLLFIAFNISGFLKKPFIPLAIFSLAAEFGVVFFIFSKLRFMNQFDKVFPQFLESLSRIYSVYPDLKQALLFSQKILKDNALQKFLKQVNAMVAVGVLPTEAMEMMAERWQYDQLFHLVSAIKLHQRFGGNLSELFANKATALQRNAQSKSAVKSALFQNKISALVICILVPAVFILSVGLSEQYRLIILSEKTAKSMILFAGIWWSVGVVVMWRTLRFKL